MLTGTIVFISNQFIIGLSKPIRRNCIFCWLALKYVEYYIYSLTINSRYVVYSKKVKGDKSFLLLLSPSQNWKHWT